MILIHILLGITLLPAQTLDMEKMEILGLIVSRLHFGVDAVNPRIYNLVEDQEIQPGGRGVTIGMWTLSVQNPPAGQASYTVSYRYDPLKAPGIDDEIGFIIIQSDAELVNPELKESGSTSDIIITGESNSVTKFVSARLTAEGAQAVRFAAASEGYHSDVTVALLTE